MKHRGTENIEREADNKSFAELVEIHPSLTDLDMSGRGYLDIEELAIIEAALKKNANLKTLNISGNSLIKTMGIRLGEALKLNSSLTKLKMAEMGDIDEEGFFAIAEALKSHPSLKILDLSNNWEIKGVAIGEIIKGNSSLEVIDLGINEDECCGGNSFGKEECEAIGEALKINSTLKSLDLSFNTRSQRALEVIEEARQNNPSLSVDLSMEYEI